jgi:hypothetical protein
MLLKETMEQLSSGKIMHRRAWSIEEGYLVLMPGMKHVWKIVLIPTPNAGNYIFSFEDITANDWIEYTFPVEPIEAV